MNVLGQESHLRAAACMMGTRFGIWLSVRKVKQGFDVTRLDVPPSLGRKRKIAVEDRIKRVEEGVRFLCVLLVEVKAMIEDLKNER